MQEALKQLNQSLRVHGLADQVQLRRLPRTEIRFTEYAWEQVQQEVAPAVEFTLGAIRHGEHHRIRNHSGFQRPEAFLKVHRSTPFRSASIAAPRWPFRCLPSEISSVRFAHYSCPARWGVYNKRTSSSST